MSLFAVLIESRMARQCADRVRQCSSALKAGRFVNLAGFF